MGVTCWCGKRRYLVWSRNRSILPPWPVSSISIRPRHCISMLPFSFTLSLSSFSAPSSRSFYAVSPSHNALRCISIRIYIDRSTVTIFTFRELSFLSLVRHPLRLFHLPQWAHFFDTSSRSSWPLSHCPSHLLDVYFLFPDWIPILQHLQRAIAPLPTWSCDDLDTILSFGVAITSFAILPYFDLEPAASGSFSFSRSSKMLSSR